MRISLYQVNLDVKHNINNVYNLNMLNVKDNVKCSFVLHGILFRMCQ